MRKLHLVTLGLIALVALAGCNIPGMSNDDAPEAEFGPDTITADNLTKSNHAELQEAGSFSVDATGQYNTTSDSAFVGNTTFNQAIVVDFESNQSKVTSTYYGSETTRYTNSEGTYSRTTTGNETKYDVDEIPYNNSRLEPVDKQPISTSLFTNITFEKTGYTTHNGETVATYHSQNPDVFAEKFEKTTKDTVTIERANATVYLNEDGVITYVKTEYEGQSNDSWFQLSTTRNVTDIGSTTVDEPVWIDDAIANSSTR